MLYLPVRKLAKTAIVSSSLIATVWVVYYLFAGQTPGIPPIKLTSNLGWQLDLGQSRWWDVVLIGLVWLPAYKAITSSNKYKLTIDFVVWNYLGICGGFLIGLMALTGQMVVKDVIMGLTAMGLFCCLCIGRQFADVACAFLLAGFTTSLIAGWPYGLIIALPAYILLQAAIFNFDVLVIFIRISAKLLGKLRRKETKQESGLQIEMPVQPATAESLFEES